MASMLCNPIMGATDCSECVRPKRGHFEMLYQSCRKLWWHLSLKADCIMVQLRLMFLRLFYSVVLFLLLSLAMIFILILLAARIRPVARSADAITADMPWHRFPLKRFMKL